MPYRKRDLFNTIHQVAAHRASIAAAAWLVACGLLMGANCPAPNSSSPYGVNGLYSQPHTFVMVQRAVEAGFKWWRITAQWDKIEPVAPDASGNHTYDFSSIHGEITAAYGAGFSILADLVNTPVWARDAPRPECNDDAKPEKLPPVNGSDFQAFAKAMAVTYGSLIAAWELWGEQNQCFSWRGTAAQYRDRILGPGFDGIKSAGNPVAIVVAPGLYNSADFDPYITYAGPQGQRWLVRPIDYYSLHTYEGIDAARQDMNQASSYPIRCTEDGSYCLGFYWLTEFGAAEPGNCADPNCPGCGPCPVDAGNWAVNVIDHCLTSPAAFACLKVMYWNIGNDYNCCVRWLVDRDGTPTAKYAPIKDYILSHPLP